MPRRGCHIGRATPQEPEHGTQGHAGHRPTQLVIPRQQVPQPMRQAQDPRSNRFSLELELEAPSGFEPEMEVLQTSALPLGDGALIGGLLTRKCLRDKFQQCEAQWRSL